MPQAVNIGNYFLYHNQSLTKISLPQVTTIENLFLAYNEKLEQFYAPKLTQIGINFLDSHLDKEKLLKNKDNNITDNNHIIYNIQKSLSHTH